MKKYFLITGILLAFSYGGYRWYRQNHSINSSKQENTDYVTASRRDLENIVRCTGEVKPEHLADIKAEVSGQVAEVKVQAGDQVSKDQILMELDRRELESQIKEATLEIERSQLLYEKTKLDADRKDKLFQKKLISEDKYKDSQIDASLGQKELELNQARLETLKQKLVKTTIRSPQDGTVLSVDVQEGSVIVGANSVSAGTVLMKIAELSQLQVETDINEIDVTQISKGMPVYLTFESMPELNIKGEIKFVSPAARASQPNNSVDSGSGTMKVNKFPMVVSFSSKESKIRPGASANIAIPISKVVNVVTLDIPAVFYEEDHQIVYVKKGDSIERREIEIGINNPKFVEIKKGVSEGEHVALTRPITFAPHKKDKS